MASNVKKRIFYFDELRALAIICVILCHITIHYRPFVYTGIKASIPGFLYIATHIAVPLFFMLSGALLLNRNYDLKEFFTKRFSRIIYPFIFWVIVACAVSLFVLHNGSGDAIKIILGESRWTWFVWTMIGIYLILPVINTFVKDYGLKGCKYFILIWLVTVILKTFHHYPFHRLELSYFFGYIGYLVLGYYLVNHDFKLSDKKMMIIGILLFVVFIGIDYMITAMDISSIETKYLSLFVVLASVGVFLFFRYYTHYCESNPTKAISRFHSRIENGIVGSAILSLSVCSYGMYLVNSIIYKCLPNPLTSLKLLPVFFILVLFLSWLFVKIVSKIPGLKKFSGAA